MKKLSNIKKFERKWNNFLNRASIGCETAHHDIVAISFGGIYFVEFIKKATRVNNRAERIVIALLAIDSFNTN